MSQSQEQDLFFNLERDILNRSPPLVPWKPTLEHKEEAPPLVPVDSSSDSSDPEDPHTAQSSRKPRRRKGRTLPTFADGVLIRSLDPNQVKLAAYVETHALESASQSEAEEGDHVAEAREGQRLMGEPEDVVEPQATGGATKPRDIAEAALNAIPQDAATHDDWLMVDPPISPTEDEAFHARASVLNARDSTRQAQSEPRLPARQDDVPKKLNTLPPPLKESLRLNLDPSREKLEDDEDSIIKSPALAKFAITPDHAPPDSILPAMQQKSPPRSSPANSPDQRQTLPGLMTAIGNLKDSAFAHFSIRSPISRPSPSHLGPYASPVSYMPLSPQPLGPPSQYPWRATTRDSNTSSSSYASSSITVSTPASSMTMPSPNATSHPSALAAVPEQENTQARRDSFDESDSPPPAEALADLNHADISASARFAAGTYKCTYPGCNAAPFQTQYLLNSHMNVHSSTRTHFCPVKNCPRGPGGLGFKRKNEMIRCV
jgi:hypothetical protein